jgi:F0F1-type ATP synthase membrane subunit c/vacuolar-type H+-ATPase subunit K
MPFEKCADIFDRMFTQERVHAVERVIIYAAVAGLAIHLAIIGVATAGIGPPRLLELAGPSFLNALYTPFSFILVYEVFGLILALSRSFSSSIGVQYQIIALIFVRRIFGDIGHLGEVEQWNWANEWVRWLAYDMVGALALFLLVTVFLHVGRGARDQTQPEGVDTFIHIKKSITLVVAGFAVAIAVYSLGVSAQEVFSHVIEADVLAIDIDFVFYRDLFTVLVFADVFVLLAAYRYSDEFSLIFRNVGFAVSTILLRLSMSVPRPWDVAVAIASLLFGICVFAIYRYYQSIEAAEQVEPEKDDAVEIA